MLLTRNGQKDLKGWRALGSRRNVFIVPGIEKGDGGWDGTFGDSRFGKRTRLGRTGGGEASEVGKKEMYESPLSKWGGKKVVFKRKKDRLVWGWEILDVRRQEDSSLLESSITGARFMTHFPERANGVHASKIFGGQVEQDSEKARSETGMTDADDLSGIRKKRGGRSPSRVIASEGRNPNLHEKEKSVQVKGWVNASNEKKGSRRGVRRSRKREEKREKSALYWAKTNRWGKGKKESRIGVGGSENGGLPCSELL